MPTVTGTFQKPDGSVITEKVVFVKTTAPELVGSVVATGHTIRATPNGSGFVSTTLLAGDYRVYPWDDDRYITIAVASTPSTQDVSTIVTTEVSNTAIGSSIRLRLADGSIATLTVISVDGQKVLSIA